MPVWRLDLTERCCDHEQAVRVAAHQLQPLHEYWPLYCQRANEVGEILPLHYAPILQPGNRIVPKFQSPFLHACEPTLKAGEVERVLLASIHHDGGAGRFKLRASALGQYRYYRRRDRSIPTAPRERRLDQGWRSPPQCSRSLGRCPFPRILVVESAKDWPRDNTNFPRHQL